MYLIRVSFRSKRESMMKCRRIITEREFILIKALLEEYLEFVDERRRVSKEETVSKTEDLVEEKWSLDDVNRFLLARESGELCARCEPVRRFSFFFFSFSLNQYSIKRIWKSCIVLKNHCNHDRRQLFGRQERWCGRNAVMSIGATNFPTDARRRRRRRRTSTYRCMTIFKSFTRGNEYWEGFVFLRWLVC